MNLTDIVDIAVSGLEAQRVRMTLTASNLANADSTRTAAGGPYRRRDPVFTAEPRQGSFASALDRRIHTVEVSRVVQDSRGPELRYQPGHPDADDEGFVAMPRVNVVDEMANMVSATRSFEANLIVLRKVREIAQAALALGR